MGYKTGSVSEIGERLKQTFLTGTNAQITQYPGAAAPSTRKFYSNHAGYDYATAPGTPLKLPAGAKVVKSYMDQSGYGQRAVVQLPTGEQWALSHLSKVAIPQGGKTGDVFAYTGGARGTYGAGNTTGPHLDIAAFDPKTVAANVGNYYQQALRSVSQGAQRANPMKLLEAAKSKYGKNLIAYASNPQRLVALAKKSGGRIIKL